MHATVRAQYGLLTVHHAIKGLVALKQKDGEELLDFVKSFKEMRGTYRNYMEAAWFDHHAETTDEFRAAATDAARQAVKDKQFETYSGLLLLLSASQAEYGKVNKQLMMQFSMGTDQ